MFDTAFILKLIVFLLLAGYLIQRQLKRSQLKQRARRQRVAPPGHVIDVAPIRPRLAAVKRDHAAEAHNRAGPARARDGLVAAARERLGTMGFFKSSPDESEERHSA